MHKRLTMTLLSIFMLVLLITIGVFIFANNRSPKTSSEPEKIQQTNQVATAELIAPYDSNPLKNKKFYIDNTREITKLANQYHEQGNIPGAELLDRIAKQPGTTWLIGPSTSDQKAERDISEVMRTSTEAIEQGAVPIYQLYAIPNRDSCAGYSRGGFSNNQQYIEWIDNILSVLKSDAVFIVEADSVGHTLEGGCLSQQQVNERLELLQAVTKKLAQNSQVIGSYLDAGHSEWFPDPNVLVDSLKKAGVENTRGVAVNVSFSVSTDEITMWAQNLISLLGDEKGVLIDTSRNGRGVPDKALTGTSRWCNPRNLGLGPVPNTKVNETGVDAYFWGKIIGESDGACFGYPDAGVFVPSIALELAQNSSN